MGQLTPKTPVSRDWPKHVRISRGQGGKGQGVQEPTRT